MPEYTPTTEEVRKGYIGLPEDAYSDPLVGAEFDRWLADHDKEVAARAWSEGKQAWADYKAWRADL